VSLEYLGYLRLYTNTKGRLAAGILLGRLLFTLYGVEPPFQVLGLAQCVVPAITKWTAATSIFVSASPPQELGNILFFFDHVGVCHSVISLVHCRLVLLNTTLRFVEMIKEIRVI
jgi:hypothetical protein